MINRRNMLQAMLGMIVARPTPAKAQTVVAHTTDCKALALRPPVTQCPPFRHRPRLAPDLATLRRLLEARHDAS
jgi:hypothetical protein